jgi:hypothetical protein
MTDISSSGMYLLITSAIRARAVYPALPTEAVPHLSVNLVIGVVVGVGVVVGLVAAGVVGDGVVVGVGLGVVVVVGVVGISR